MNIKLNSDFMDYYDAWFCPSTRRHDVIFNRYANDFGPNREEMFNIFAKNGIKTPIHGYLCDLKDISLELNQVVVYLDKDSHRGEDKIILDYNEAIKSTPYYFCSEYISDEYGISYRLLRIGNQDFYFRYESNYWKSNYGDNIEIFWICEDTVNFPEIGNIVDNPIFAIDFVKRGNELLAIDLNLSPQIKGTGVENIYKPKIIYNLIEEYYEIPTSSGSIIRTP